ncbi:hypothetical protein D9M71_329680 [compost metagenome]
MLPALAAFFGGVGQPCGAVEGDPGHHLGVHELLPAATHFPDALVRLAPDAFDIRQYQARNGGAARVTGQPAPDRLSHRIGQFAIDVQLCLRRGGVAHPHRLRMLITGQPRQGVLLQVTLASQAIHDLHLLGVAGHRAQKPLTPSLGLVEVTKVHEGQQGHGRVAQPTEAVVPIALATHTLRQRRGDGSDNTAGGGVGHGLEGEQRPTHQGGIWPYLRAAVGEGLPLLTGVCQGVVDVAVRLHRQVRGLVTQAEDLALARADAKAAAGVVVAGLRGHGAAQDQPVRAGDGTEGQWVKPFHPGHAAAVVEAHDQVHFEMGFASQAFDDAHHRIDFAQGHEVEHPGTTAGGDPGGFQHQGVAQVLAAAVRYRVARGQAPAAIFFVAQQGREHGGGVEAWQAQPVQRAIATDQRRTAAVAQQGVVFDVGRH